MANKLYDLSVKVGSYEKDGQTKGKYKNIGVMMDSANGPYILLDKTFNPAGVPGQEGKENIIVSCYEPQRQSNRAPDPGYDDSTPF